MQRAYGRAQSKRVNPDSMCLCSHLIFFSLSCLLLFSLLLTGSQDIPLSFNVTLLAASPNTAPQSVLGSKASAEPPMMLSCSLFFAVRDAIAAVRADQGLTEWFDLPTPASTQTVQLACGINAASLVL